MSGKHKGKHRSKKKHSTAVGTTTPKINPNTDRTGSTPDNAGETAIAQSYDKMKSRWFQKPDPFDLAVWGFLVGLAVAGIYYLQLRSMQQQVIEMRIQTGEVRRQTEVSERPWLSLEAIPVNGLIWVNGNQASLLLKFSLKNVGHSIAKSIQIDAKMFPIGADVPVAPDAVQNQRELCDKPKISPIGNFDMFPVDQPTERELDVSVIPSAIEAQSISISTKEKTRNFLGFYVVGCATYRSSFSPSFHQTRFSYHLIGPNSFTPDGKPLMHNGIPLIGAFEIGVDVPKGKLGMLQEIFGQNEAN